MNLLRLCLAAALTLYTTNTIGSRTLRIVDSLRLLVDSEPNLQDEALHVEAKAWSSDELESWARRLMVRYEVRRGEGVPATVVLTRVSKIE